MISTYTIFSVLTEIKQVPSDTLDKAMRKLMLSTSSNYKADRANVIRLNNRIARAGRINTKKKTQPWKKK